MSRDEALGGRTIGRYALYDELASGGMATVFWGRLAGPAGFSRTVAIKRLHPQFAKDPEFAAMFLDEARLASRIRHGNVVSTLDVVTDDGELFLIMDYVHGEALGKLVRAASSRGERVPLAIAGAIVSGVLHGLHAAHEATADDGAPLAVVHRDVSPQNVLVGTDGIPRVLDFGVAKAAWSSHTTRDGALKGKLPYMAPEQLRGEPIDRRVDVFSSAIVLWELLTGRRLFGGQEPHVYMTRILGGDVAPPRTIVPELTPALDAIVMKGLALDPNDRFATARDMALALEKEAPPAPASDVGAWVARIAGPALEDRRAHEAAIERQKNEDRRTPSAEEGLPAGVMAKVVAAEGRRQRAGLATAPEFAPSSASAGVALTPAIPARDERAPSSAPRRGLVALALTVGVVFAAALLRPSRAIDSSTPPAPAMPARGLDVDAQPLLETPTGVATTVTSDPSSGAPRTIDGDAAVARAHAPRATAPHPAPAKPTPSSKGALCMKQRADGVVYFAACP